MNNIENTTPIDVLADRVWSGTKWHYPNIEKLIARITALEAKLTAALATVEKCKQAAENAIDHAENAMDQGDADEAFARCNAGLRAVAAAAKGGGE